MKRQAHTRNQVTLASRVENRTAISSRLVLPVSTGTETRRSLIPNERLGHHANTGVYPPPAVECQVLFLAWGPILGQALRDARKRGYFAAIARSPRSQTARIARV